MRLGALKTSLHPNLLDRPQPAEEPGAFEERGRQVLARLADGERGDERGGGAIVPRSLQSDAPAPSVTDGWNGVATSKARSPAPGSGAICAIGTMGTGEQTGSRIA
jgi:hypothetical protein